MSAAISAVTAIALAATALSAADDHRRAMIALTVASLVVLTAGLVTGLAPGVWVAVALLGTAAAVARAPGAPLIAVGLFVVAEVGWSATAERYARRQDAGVYAPRLALLAAVVAASLAVGAAMRLVARGDGPQSSAYTVVAALGIVALVALVVARTRTGVRTG